MNCTTCPCIDQCCNNYTLFSKSETYKIKSYITWQYFQCYLHAFLIFNILGKPNATSDHLNEYRRPILNPSGGYIQTTVSEHVLGNSHSVSHMLPIPIETVRYECDCLRKARVAHIIHKAKTIDPLGMNKRDEQ